MPENAVYEETILEAVGAVGQRLTVMGAAEGTAGNISICWHTLHDPERLLNRFPHAESCALPEAAPALAGSVFLATGSGIRLSDIAANPAACLGVLTVAADGQSGTLHTAESRCFSRLTSEFNSHFAVYHAFAKAETPPVSFRALLHAQPLHLTYLSHMARYRDTRRLNRHILRWQPESVVFLPGGVGVAPFVVPGSDALRQATAQLLRVHTVALWAKHGVMARSEKSLGHACDLIEYAEVGARYEVLNLSAGERGEGLTDAEIRAICAEYGVSQDYF